MMSTTIKKTTKSSELLPNQPTNQVVRWYVLVYPERGREKSKGLELELAKRKKNGETLFEYLAPAFVETKEENGKLIITHRPLLYEYLFIHASESEIYKIKKYFPYYNFLPRVSDGKDKYHYPYISDESIRNLQWIARSYANVIPVYAADPAWLINGDKIRITKGQFKDIEACIITQPNSRRKDIVVYIENWMCIPLLRVKSDQYEIVKLNADNSRYYTHLNNERLQEQLHEALCRHHKGEATEEDMNLASDALQRYANLTVETDVMRCKLYSLLLPAYTILGNKEKRDELIGMIQLMLPSVKAEQSLALLTVMLYGCTDSSLCYDRAHAIVDAWQAEENPKKNKVQLIRRLGDYDRCLGHYR